jgi:choline dehydrogenase-like flavoprotein
VLLDGRRAVGVRVRQGTRTVDYRAGEVILSAGGIATPLLLELSGIGSPQALRRAGIAVRIESPHVGSRVREHRTIILQWRLRRDVGYNPLLRGAFRRARTGASYLLTRRGVLALPAYDVIAFCRTRPDVERPDAMLLLAPFSIRKDTHAEELEPESLPGMCCAAYILRPESEGSIHVASSDPDATATIDPGYLSCEHDRRTTVDLARRIREIAAGTELSELIESETLPGPQIETDEQLASFALADGNCAFHAIGGCAMGPTNDHVLDPTLRVRGVDGLRVVDCSAWPAMPSGNTNAPTMAMAWHAADVIASGR